MYKTTLNLAAILSATLLTACGGGGSGESAANALTPTQPQNTAFDAAKQYRREILLSKSYNQMFRPYDISVNGHVIFRVSGDIQSAFKETDFRSLPTGYSSHNGTLTRDNRTTPVNVLSYQGFHSGTVQIYDQAIPLEREFYGIPTPSSALPAKGQATYTGMAFDQYERGKFTYDVDFATKTGHGSIEGFGRYGDLFLEEAQINPFWKQTGSPSTSITHGKITDTKGSRNLYYLLNLYGDHAEEIAGYAEMEGKESIGFHGTRGDISN